MRRRAFVIGAGVVALVAPTPSAWVERFYARGVYTALQPRLTWLSNRTDLALFDPLVSGIILGLLVWWIVQLRRARARPDRVRVLWLALIDTVVALSAVYLLFLATWGLNYRRQPLRDRIEFQRDRVTAPALLEAARAATTHLNELWHRVALVSWPDLDAMPTWLAPAFTAAAGELRVSPTALGKPKTTIFSWYFRRSAVDGMTDPFMLEILINPDVLPFERPFVVAHEWAHLAGHAQESEANFIAWVTCLRGDPRAQYSGWLALYPYLLRSAPPEERRALATELSPGPRRDLGAIAARLARASPAVRRAAARAYDRFLKANRVGAGIASYDEVVQLVLGTRFAQPRASR